MYFVQQWTVIFVLSEHLSVFKQGQFVNETPFILQRKWIVKYENKENLWIANLIKSESIIFLLSGEISIIQVRIEYICSIAAKTADLKMSVNFNSILLPFHLFKTYSHVTF